MRFTIYTILTRTGVTSVILKCNVPVLQRVSIVLRIFNRQKEEKGFLVKGKSGKSGRSGKIVRGNRGQVKIV
jgi:hypothetical protein